MREDMRRTICAVNIQRWEDRLYRRKQNGIPQRSLEYVSQNCVEAKSICN